MKSIIIGAPYGNFISSPCATRMIGPFSAKGLSSGRPTRVFLRCCRSLRWRPKAGLLCLPGLFSLSFKDLISSAGRSLEGNILSIYCDAPERIEEILIAARMLGNHNNIEAVELHIPDREALPRERLDGLFEATKGIRRPIIIRPPMIGLRETVSVAMGYGFSQFHVCPPMPDKITNTTLRINRLHTVGVIRMLKDWNPSFDVIAGGWIRGLADVELYRTAGASTINVGRMMSSPWMWLPCVRNKALVAVANHLESCQPPS